MCVACFLSWLVNLASPIGFPAPCMGSVSLSFLTDKMGMKGSTGGPVDPHSQSRGPGFDPRSGN